MPSGSSSLLSFALMLIVVIPVIVMAFWFPWKYRASNTKAIYTPKWSYSVKIELVVWLVPVVIVTALGILVWNTTYHLDPYKPIDPAVKPVSIEAVSLDWKWLFIYPDQQYRRRQSTRVSRPCSAELQDHLGHGNDLFFHPATGQPDLRHGGHADPVASHGR